VLAGNEREALLRVADQLSAELDYPEGGEIPGAHTGLGRDGSPARIVVDSADELLIAEIRRGLAGAAAAAAFDGEESESTDVNAVIAALDCAEMVMRGEIAMDNAGRLPALLPSFVYLVTLPVVDQDRALQLSKRCARLIEQVF
jgi:hypothetical protein